MAESLGEDHALWPTNIAATLTSLLIFEDGYIVRGLHKRCSFTYLINVQDEKLIVYARFASDDPRAKLGCLDVEYELPVASLLWRKAPLGELPNLQVEAADYVKITELEKPLEGIKPSPVLIQ